MDRPICAGKYSRSLDVEPPEGKGRTVAAIFAPVHNVRVIGLKAAAKENKISEQLDCNRVTPSQATKGPTLSYAALNAIIQSALTGADRVKVFKPDLAGFIGYLITHDAHHRWQILMLARQAGHPVSQKAMFGRMWAWGSRSQQ